MSRTSINMNLLTFGSDDAEFDEKHGFLDKVFLKTTIYNRAKDAKRELVIGSVNRVISVLTMTGNVRLGVRSSKS